MKVTDNEYIAGWYAREQDDNGPFRWMGKKALVSIKDYPEPGKKYLRITAGHSFPDKELPILDVYVNDRKVGIQQIEAAYAHYVVSFEDVGVLNIAFKLSRTTEVVGDPRELGIMVRDLEIVLPSEIELYLDGWYMPEESVEAPVPEQGRWMKQEARVLLPAREVGAHAFISFYAFSEYANFRQILRVELNGEELGAYPLIKNWNFYSYPLPSDQEDSKETHGCELRLSLNRIFPDRFHAEDPRELGVKVSPIKFHDEIEIHRDFLFFHRNCMLNHEELKRGETQLKSYPIKLGIDLLAKCNMKPPCVYCHWDWVKAREEGHIETVVDESTLRDYGPFFRSARLLMNCSIGEPLLHPRFDEILEYCTKHNKVMEISTNGQAFTDRTIDALVGKPVYLYVSLDAATKETYAKIRNDRWETIIPNLIRLNEERKKKGNLPRIHMVFMPMRVNENELEGYFKLCQKIEADALILRALHVLNRPKTAKERGGYLFDYKNELLSHKELKDVFKECQIFSEKYGIPVANQFRYGIRDEGPVKGEETVDIQTQNNEFNHQIDPEFPTAPTIENLKAHGESTDRASEDEGIEEPGIPLCIEPWENLYILRRGILPCSYGDTIGYAFPDYLEAWNSPELQEIRRYLSQGKLSPYCKECLVCPIVQRYLAEHRPGVFRLINRMLFRFKRIFASEASPL